MLGGGGGLQGSGGVGEGVEGYGGDIIKTDLKRYGKGFGRGEQRLRYHDGQPEEKAKRVLGQEG